MAPAHLAARTKAGLSIYLSGQLALAPQAPVWTAASRNQSLALLARLAAPQPINLNLVELLKSQRGRFATPHLSASRTQYGSSGRTSRTNGLGRRRRHDPE